MTKRSASGVHHWSRGLVASLEDPDLKVDEDELVVIIKDKYPKAEVHYLILPKEDINHLGQLQKQHLDLLRRMKEWGEKMIEKHPKHTIRLGFHSVPSMARLHLHVISQDFNSECLKTRHHWNTFTTSYFLPISSVLSQLESKGSVTKILSTTAKGLLETKLKCNKCSFEPKTMPQLKSHLLTHCPKETKD